MDTYPKGGTSHTIRSRSLAVVFLLWLYCTAAHADNSPTWGKTLTSNKGPGNFGTFPDVNLAYELGWSGIQAAQADIHFYSRNRNIIEIEASAATLGLARSLFKLDVHQKAEENRTTLNPIRLFQEERYRSETVKTNVIFSPNSVTGTREKIPSDKLPKPNTFEFGPIFDLSAAFLWIRSQPLKDDDTEQLVVWAFNAPYLATIRVVGRETLRIKGEEKKAIKLDLKLKGIGKKLELKEHKLFKSGRGWLSDDVHRFPLRLEANIFIGYIYAELAFVNLKPETD